MSTFQTGLVSDLSVSRLGKAGGFAPLGLDSKIPNIYLPTALAGGLALQGGYDASTNVPDLNNNAQQVDGALYITTTSGTQDLGDGPKLFTVGDAIFYSSGDSKWYHLQSSVLALEVAFDNSTSSLTSETVQDAIVEVLSNAGSDGFNSTPTADYIAGRNITLTNSGGNNLIAGETITSATEDTVLFGREINALAGAETSVLFGSIITSTGITYSLGFNQNITGNQSIGLGADSTIAGDESISIGISADTNGQNSIAMGSNSNAQQLNSVQIGVGTNNVANSLQYQTVPIANNRVVTPFQIGSESTNTINAVIGEILPVDVRTSVAIINPPNLPQPLDTFAITDSRANSSINNINIDFVTAGQLLHGSIQNYVMNDDSAYVEFVYINSTIGWINKKG